MNNKKYIVFSDPHIEESCLTELEQVFSEILTYSKGKPILVCGGDYYEKKNPTAKEIAFGTKWAMKFKKEFADFIMVAGNHPAVEKNVSGVSYLEYLGVTIAEETTLDNTYYGHYMVKESLCGFAETKEGKDLTDRYELSILGHQHSYQEITIDNSRIVHPGSVRYVDFGETCDKSKFILFVEDCDFVPVRLNKVRQMLDVDSVTKLGHVSKEAQVRVVYTDFSKFLSEAHLLEKLEKEFFKFRVKYAFNNIPQQGIINLTNTNKEIVEKWLNSIDNVLVKDELTLEFKKSGIL